ncbi:MAG: hypothetical protein JWO87_2323 [Phycisphaerales bacterium]|nr:hypothetical protein [Phycisphaerales bacterium]
MIRAKPFALSVLACILMATFPAAGANVTFDARSARSGNWSDPKTWADGRAPKAGDFVQIRAGDVVTYDAASDDAIRMIHVAGTLTFSRDKSTRLSVGLIKIQAGTDASEEGFDCDAHFTTGPSDSAGGPTPALEIGTADEPIPTNVTATLRLVYFPGTDKESLPAIIDCAGRWDVHGSPMVHTWSKLAVAAKAGADSVTLADDPGGWKPGDRVVLTRSAIDDFASHHPELTTTEERIITAVDGKTIRFDQPLTATHVVLGGNATEAANLSRNVVIESADPQGVRGHTMYHFQSTGGISYAEFRHLGKRNVLGKYPVHFHLVRDSMRGNGVVGASIWDSQNRFMAIHGTDYLLVRDCVGYQCVGHGFFLEDATEQYNLLDHNIAIQALKGKKLPKQALDFDDNEGAGFWWANGRNTLVRNVACENHLYGYKFQIEKSHGKTPVYRVRQPDGSIASRDIRTIPFLRFEDNESHCDGLYAFNFGDDPAGAIHSDTSHPFIARNLRVWQSHYALRPNLWSFLMEGLAIDHAVYGVYHPDYCDHVYRNIYLNTVISEPINRGHDDESIQYGSFTYENLTLENCKIGRDPIIQLTCTSPKPGQTGHFRNVIFKNSISHDSNVVDLGGGPRNDKLENGVVYYFHDMPQQGQALKVVSVHFPQLMNDGEYKQLPGFTGPDVKAAAVAPVPFPTLLTPVDDLPPATIITTVRRSGDKLLVRGVSQDDGEIASVSVNGEPARITASHSGVADWEITLEAAGVKTIDAKTTDKAGNVEQMPAVRTVETSATYSKG